MNGRWSRSLRALVLRLNTMKGHLSEEFSPCPTLSPKIGNCLGTPERESAERKATFAARRQQMLSDKVDCAKFLTWFIENYPASATQTRNADSSFWTQFR